MVYPITEVFGPTDWDGPLDLASIMMYPSICGNSARDSVTNQLKPVIMHCVSDPSAPSGTSHQLVFQGGNRRIDLLCGYYVHLLMLPPLGDPSQAGISPGDAARVKQLYPLPPQNAHDPKGDEAQPERLPTVKVIIGSWTATVAPVPSQTPIINGTEEYNKFVRQYLDASGKPPPAWNERTQPPPTGT